MAAVLRMPAASPLGERQARAAHVLKALHMSHLLHARIGDAAGGGQRGISGGEKRRVGVAMELMSEPRVLFLDEPTSGLDSYNAGAWRARVCVCGLAVGRVGVGGCFVGGGAAEDDHNRNPTPRTAPPLRGRAWVAADLHNQTSFLILISGSLPSPLHGTNPHMATPTGKKTRVPPLPSFLPQSCSPPDTHPNHHDKQRTEVLVDVLAEVARARDMAVLLSIHQPKYELFARLHRVLLLHRGALCEPMQQRRWQVDGTVACVATNHGEGGGKYGSVAHPSLLWFSSTTRRQ